jgi:hypothetical protein
MKNSSSDAERRAVDATPQSCGRLGAPSALRTRHARRRPLPSRRRSTAGAARRILSSAVPTSWSLLPVSDGPFPPLRARRAAPPRTGCSIDHTRRSFSLPPISATSETARGGRRSIPNRVAEPALRGPSASGARRERSSWLLLRAPAALGATSRPGERARNVHRAETGRERAFGPRGLMAAPPVGACGSIRGSRPSTQRHHHSISTAPTADWSPHALS